MTDKVQKIREKVERLMYGFNLEADIASCEDAESEKIADIKYQLCKKILEYIDSLQEEPVSEDIEEAAESYAKYERSDGDGGIDVTRLDAFIEGAQWQKKQKPVSEDLEDAAKRYALNNTPYEDCTDEMSDAFKAGAQWQKQQDSIPSKDLAELIDTLSKRYPEVSFAKLSRIAVRVAKWKEKEMQSTIELVEDHAILTGMNKMEQQMMAKAIDAQCFGFQGAALFSFRLPADKYLVGSEVKVIVIEED